MALSVRDLGACAYLDALALQQSLVAAKLDGERDDYLLFVEHEAVYTLGRGADDADLCGADRLLGVPAHRTSRGGGVTFHGPGQLVAYPILALERGDCDVGAYVRRLEQTIIACCAHFGVVAERHQGSPGAWVGGAKIASIGVGIRRWITFHGMALNVTTDLSYFDAIVPCREAGMRITSLAQQLGWSPGREQVRAAFEACFRQQFAAPVEMAQGATAG